MSEIVYGIDIGRFGNEDTILCRRTGENVEIERIGKTSLRDLIGQITDKAERDQVKAIHINAVGHGSVVADVLSKRFNVIPILSACTRESNRVASSVWFTHQR